MKIINRCELFGHSWLYNFSTIPSKGICSICNTKIELNLRILEWDKVDSFDESLGTDEEIKKRWFKHTK